MNLCGQFSLHLLYGGLDVGIDLDLVDVLGRLPRRHFGAGLFDLADRPGARNGALGNFALQVGVGQAEQAAAVTGGEFAVGDELLDVLRELKQAHQIDDRGTVFAGAQADGFGIQVEFGRHTGEGAGSFHRVEIFALNILDQGDLEQPVLGDFADHDGDRGYAGEFGGSPPSLTRYQLVVAIDMADYQGLDNPVGANGLREFRETIVLEDAAGLQRIGLDVVDRDVERSLTRLGRRVGYGRRRRGVGTGGQERPPSLTQRSARVFWVVPGRGALLRG